MNEKTALLIIDVQQGLFERQTPVHQAKTMLENIYVLAEKAHKGQSPLVYIQHSNDKTLKLGTPEWKFHPQIKPLDGDLHIQKQRGNAFEKTDLHKILQSLDINRIVASGMVTNGCVRATCLGGLKLGYQMILASDAHSTFSKGADQVIKYWEKELAKAGVIMKASAEIDF